MSVFCGHKNLKIFVDRNCRNIRLYENKFIEKFTVYLIMIPIRSSILEAELVIPTTPKTMVSVDSKKMSVSTTDRRLSALARYRLSNISGLSYPLMYDGLSFRRFLYICR